MKIRLPVFALGDGKKKGKGRYTKSQVGYISALWGVDPVLLISTKVGKVIGVHEVIIHSKSGFNILRGFTYWTLSLLHTCSWIDEKMNKFIKKIKKWSTLTTITTTIARSNNKDATGIKTELGLQRWLIFIEGKIYKWFKLFVHEVGRGSGVLERSLEIAEVLRGGRRRSWRLEAGLHIFWEKFPENLSRLSFDE